MNTPAHLLLGVALFGRKEVPRSGWAAALGSLVPDLSLYLMAGAALFALQIPPERVFGELYFSDAWQTVFAIDNSFVIWGMILLVAVWFRNSLAIAFAGGGLVHMATDFPLHNDDARPHFWPLTDWVFASPLSYWDSGHHAAAVVPVLVCVAMASAIVIWRRWHRLGVRAAVLVAVMLELWVARQWLVFF